MENARWLVALVLLFTTTVFGAATNIYEGSQLRFWEEDDSNYIGFVAPTLSASYLFTLPDSNGAAGYLLAIDSANKLYWAATTAGANEVDPCFAAWDKSTGISITESQISDLQSYLLGESDPCWTAWLASPPDISIFTNDAGYLTEYNETDPCFLIAEFGGDVSGTYNAIVINDDAIEPNKIATVDIYGVSKNKILMYNGSTWVDANITDTFTFSIASFSDGESTLQLIGSGVWKADETMSYVASYNNPPPTSADVLMSINGASYNKVGEMAAPAYTSGTNTEGNINYPAAKDQYLRFRLDATDGSDPDIEYETAVYFRNYIYWGVIAKASSFTEADIEGLAGSEITNTINISKSISAGAGEYIVYAYPTSYTAMDEGDDYEDDGGTDFKFNDIAIAITRDNANLTIENPVGFSEGYDVYVSNLANLGSATFVANTTDQTINYLYYGVTEKTDTFTESDVEGLENSTVTNDNTQTWSSITTGSGEYMLFAFPKRLGTVTFYVGGFEGGFESPETVSVSNINGWSEDYYVWRSSNSNLGTIVVVTQ